MQEVPRQHRAALKKYDGAHGDFEELSGLLCLKQATMHDLSNLCIGWAKPTRIIRWCFQSYRNCLAISAAVCFAVSAGGAVTLSPPTVRSNVISFSFDSVADKLLTVQAATSLPPEWVDAAFYRGTGGLINFSAPTTGTQRFFRV